MEEIQVGPILVAAVLEERIDARNASRVRASLHNSIAQGHRRILVDLSYVDFVDSTGLGAIVGALKQIGQDGELALCGMCDRVMTLFKLTRMDKIFRLFSTRDAALATLIRG